MIRKSTGVLLVVFLVLLGGVYIWQQQETLRAAEVTPTAGASQGYLFDIDGTISGVRIERVGDRVIEFKTDEQGKWKITWPEGLQTDSDATASSLSSLAAMPLVTTLEKTPDLAAMGLDQPAYRILVTTSDGKSYVANIGKATPTNSGYYVLGSSRNVSVVSTYSLDSILGLVDNPPLLQATPTPEASTESPIGTPDALTPATLATPTP